MFANLIYYILYPNLNIVYAHSLFPGSFALINNEDVILANNKPATLNLEWSEHTVDKIYPINKPIIFKANVEGYRSVFKYPESEIEYFWKFPDGTQKSGAEVTFIPNQSGTFIIYFRVLHNIRNAVLSDDDLRINISSSVEEQEFVVNGQIIKKDAHPAERTLTVDRFVDNKFEVSQPNDKYIYTWDFPDGEALTGPRVSRKFENTKIPSYVILRTTDKLTGAYEDSYVRIESEQDQLNVVKRPPAPIDSSELEMVSPINPAIIIVLLTFFGVILVYIGFRWKRNMT